MFIKSRKIFFLVFLSFFISCVDSNSPDKEPAKNGVCMLDISLKEEWSVMRNNAISFLITAENTGELTIQTIEVTANLYFKNNNIVKSRFYLTELGLLSGEIVEKYGIFLDTNTNFLSVSGVDENDIDRIIYNAPIYMCEDN